MNSGVFCGIDACKGGWLMVQINGGNLSWRYAAGLSGLVNDLTPNNKILLDMPIGLLSGGLPGHTERPCDRIARRLLGRRHSSIFNPPCMEALYEESYQQASQKNHEILGKKLSKQSWNIAPKIREVNAFLHLNPKWRDVILEAHPELAFQWLNQSQPLQFSKKTNEGIQERLMILNDQYTEINASYEVMRADPHLKGKAVADDILDAMALAVLNKTRKSYLKPISPETVTDTLGNTMNIWL